MERFASCPVTVCVFLLLWSTVSCFQPVYNRLQKRSDDLGSVEAVVAAQAQKLSALEADLQAAKNSIADSQHIIATLQSKLNTVQSSQGSTFIRWGRSTCPSDATLIYSGIAGGSDTSHSGGGANRLCLTKEPVFDGATGAYGVLVGAEYYFPGHHFTDVVCAVCRTSHSDTFMVPGTNRCPAGTVAQYQGHLISGEYDDPVGSEFLCLDAAPEDRLGSQNNEPSGYFEYVKTHCGALPCPPYVDAKVVTCAVCSV